MFVKAGKTTDGYTTEINSVTALTNPGETLITTDITIDNYELWSTENPILYNVYTEIKTDCTEQSLITRTGFRCFEIKEDGYFYLNGKRIMLKGSHTGNFVPYSTQNIYNYEEFLRKDFMMAKALGFNMVRFISGVAVPMQLDCRCQGDMSAYEGLQSNEPHRYEPGDIHIYCLPKLNANITARFRQVASLHERPYFLSEFGIGSALDTTTLITHSFPLSRIEEAYKIFENKEDGVIKIAIDNRY